MRRLATACLFLALVLAAPAAATQWRVDHAKSHLGFTAQWSNEPFSGEFKRWEAEIEFDPADLAHSHAAVTVDLASELSGEAQFDQGLKGAMGFQVSKFPQAKFVATGIAAHGGNRYVAQGTLSLRGVDKTVTLPFSLTLSGDTAHMTGKAVVMRTDFGVGQGMWAAPDPVAHAVTVTVDLTATKTK